jgi:DNA invertase Pin-like site-specific DNA recombinase
MKYGYARVSTIGQTLAAQLDQLKAEGCDKIYREKASGAQADRRELQRMLKALASGDVVEVRHRTGRIARFVARKENTTMLLAPRPWASWQRCP